MDEQLALTFLAILKVLDRAQRVAEYEALMRQPREGSVPLVMQARVRELYDELWPAD